MTSQRSLPGFGFVSREEAKAQNGRGDVFLHFSDLDGGLTSSDLAVGVRVRFRWEAAKDSRGPGGRARLVSLVPSHPVVELSAPRPRPTRTGRVYHKDTILAMRGWMHKRGQVEKRQKWPLRPDGLPREIVFPFTIYLPDFYWEEEDQRALAHANDEQRVQMLEARLDYEGGADSNNAETFGENWALETWSYEDAVAANNMIRAAEAEAEAAASYEAASYEAASYEYGGHRDHGQCAERTSTASDDSCRIECKMHGEEQGHGVEKGWAPELCGRTRAAEFLRLSLPVDAWTDSAVSRTYKKPGLVGAPQRVPDPGGLGRWNRIAPRERVGGSAWLVRGSQVRPDPQNDPQAAEREREKLERLVEALQARQHADESGGDVMSEGSSSPKSSTGQKEDWSTMVEQLLRGYEFFKPLEELSPGLVQRLAKEVIYQEIQAEEIIFRQHDPPDGCWVVLSGSVGVFIFKRNELLDDEPPTPREEYDPSEFNTLQEERERMKQRGALRSAKTAKDLADLLTGQAEVTNPKAAKSKAGASALESWAKAEDEEPRYKSIEGFSTWSFSSVLGVQVAQLGAGRIFGELALQTNHPRAASIKCLETTAFLRIPYTTYQAVVKDIFEGLRLQQECSKILQGCSFFREIEKNQPGVIKELASRGCTMHEERKDQVLFRQGDPALNCYIILEGTIDVLIWKAEKRSKSGGLAKVRDDQPTPRFQEPLDKRTTMTEALAIWKKTADGKSNKKKFDPWPSPFTRYKTTEGFSSFAKDSKYGARVIQLKPGSIVGELALQTNEPRAATIKCATDCKFMVVGKETFREVMHEHLEMMKFFNTNLPGCKKLEYTGQHPCVHFVKRTFPENYSFMFEGIIASEPALFLMQQGTIEFRRHTHVAENSAYANRHHPLAAARLPELPLASRQSTSARRNQRLAQLQALQAAGDQRYEAPLVCQLKKDLKELQTTTAVFRATVVENPELPVKSRIRGSKWIISDVLEAPGVFCTMPFLPLPIPEPLLVVSTTIVEAYHLGGPLVDKLPQQVRLVLKEHLFKATVRRMNNDGRTDVDHFPMMAMASLAEAVAAGNDAALRVAPEDPEYASEFVRLREVAISKIQAAKDSPDSPEQVKSAVLAVVAMEQNWRQINVQLRLGLSGASGLDDQVKSWGQEVKHMRRDLDAIVEERNRRSLNLGSSIERGSALQATEMMDRSSQKLKEAKRVALETEEVGQGVLADLEAQRETILHVRDNVRTIDSELTQARRSLDRMIALAQRNRMATLIIASVFSLGLAFWLACFLGLSLQKTLLCAIALVLTLVLGLTVRRRLRTGRWELPIHH
ncbi:Vesicle transport v-SNARE 12 (AtVTI12) (Vesicle soluble NSF attachment protein receptor VTI1b) (AtVTI1b) (Vesicle transport v-SNARE protein VTI1b) [Durusdinium trenchii]|uniref:Vesicle transport v-SNARE 12 (AtVTI12) (Vesicle soluble NSF attachment protein receptor VTI1b) (AtVTI1b) (Vesicle transport v-SNARE protein VTI1b) n=2 Tax=Durusdinium trenchii TaxID=1381693 RepID=A0ABP0IDS6_9DINO